MLADGIKTYVIGFGGGLESPDAQQQLQQMAQWGGTDQPYSAATQADLVEGIRAQLVDKDRDPHWNPTTLEAVAPGLAAAALASVPAEPLWGAE